MQVNRADGELGVRFTASGNEPTSWFRTDELVTVAKPATAPNIPLHSERTRVLDAPESPVPAAPAA